GYVAAKAWGPYGVGEREWSEAFGKLTKALTNRDDVVAVVATTPNGVVTSDRVLHIISGFDKKHGVRTFNTKPVGVGKSLGGVDVFYVPGGEEGGGFFIAFYDSRKLVRWTSPEFFEELRRVGLARVSRSEFEWGSARGVRYLCFSYRVEYEEGLYGIFGGYLGSGINQWWQKFALLPLFSVLSSRIDIRQAAYEVDMSPGAAVELDTPVSMAGLVGFLQNTGYILRDLPGSYYHTLGSKGWGCARRPGLGAVERVEGGSGRGGETRRRSR
ncbi:MAG: hypothetical protein ACP5H5_06735, partial [Pyrobaculum sp.]